MRAAIDRAMSKSITIRQLAPSAEALGLIVSFVAREAPYSDYRAGSLVKAIKHQLSTRNHICLLGGETLLGYCGWLRITNAAGEKWLRNEAELVPIAPEAADASALTIVSTSAPQYLLRMIRACRTLNPDQRVYFKRDLTDGASRKTSVYNK
jgi:hypothetical protein